MRYETHFGFELLWVLNALNLEASNVAKEILNSSFYTRDRRLNDWKF